MANNYNLESPIQHEHSTIMIKKEMPEDARLRRFKDKLILILGLAILITLFLLSVFFAIQDHSNSLAISTAVSIASGFAGYLLRGKS